MVVVHVSCVSLTLLRLLQAASSTSGKRSPLCSATCRRSTAVTIAPEDHSTQVCLNPECCLFEGAGYVYLNKSIGRSKLSVCPKCGCALQRDTAGAYAQTAAGVLREVPAAAAASANNNTPPARRCSQRDSSGDSTAE
jgi:hypothetical protein